MKQKKKGGPKAGKKCDVEDCAANHEGMCGFGLIEIIEDVEPDDSMHCPE